MQKDQGQKEPFAIWLVRQFLEPDEDDPLSPEELSNKELYSMVAIIVLVTAILILTLGPSPLLR